MSEHYDDTASGEPGSLVAQLLDSLGDQGDDGLYEFVGLAQGMGGALSDGTIGGATDRANPQAGPNPRLAHAVDEEGRYYLAIVPAIGDRVSKEDINGLISSLRPGLLRRLPPPGRLGAPAKLWAYCAMQSALLNRMQSLIDAVFIGDTKKMYAGNIGIMHHNGDGVGVAENFIGVNHHDLRNDEFHASAVNLLQAITQKNGPTLELNRPAVRGMRHLDGLLSVLESSAIFRAEKRLTGGAVDPSDWFRARKTAPVWRITHEGGMYLIPRSVRPVELKTDTEGMWNKEGVPYWWDGAGVDSNMITGATAPGADTDAIHDNVDGEIEAIAPKATPTTADFLLIEDAADGDSKKRITLGDLPGGGGVTVLHTSTGADSGNVGAGEDTLKTYTMPANTMGDDKDSIRITAHGNVSNIGGDNATIKIYFGSTVIATITRAAVGSWFFQAVVKRTGANAQIGQGWSQATQAPASSLWGIVSAQNLAAGVVIKVTGQNNTDATNDAAICRTLDVEFIPAA